MRPRPGLAGQLRTHPSEPLRGAGEGGTFGALDAGVSRGAPAPPPPLREPRRQRRTETPPGSARGADS